MAKLGLQVTEKEYRALPYPSYSLLSSISKANAMAVGGERPDLDDLDGIIIGSLVDSIITDGGIPSNVVILNKKPGGKPLEIIKALSKRSDLIDDYVLSPKNKEIILEELNRVDYYGTSNFATRMNKLKAYAVYAKAISVHKNDAMFVSNYQMSIAKDLSNNLLDKYSFLTEGNIIAQVKLIGEVNGIEIKGMLDFVLVDHENKKIIPYDLKTGIGSHDSFFKKGYLGWGYYIQASLYKEILTQWIRKNNPEYDEYSIDNFRFMYCGRADKLPIVYRVTDKLHEAGFTGFKYNNNHYPGINELLDDYVYYTSNPNSFYKRGYDSEEVVFDDSFLEIDERN